MGQTNTWVQEMESSEQNGKSHDPCGDFILWERQSAIRVKLYSIPGEDIVKENLKTEQK